MSNYNDLPEWLKTYISFCLNEGAQRDRIDRAIDVYRSLRESPFVQKDIVHKQYMYKGLRLIAVVILSREEDLVISEDINIWKTVQDREMYNKLVAASNRLFFKDDEFDWELLAGYVLADVLELDESENGFEV